jgi:hypothetical protein
LLGCGREEAGFAVRAVFVETRPGFFATRVDFGALGRRAAAPAAGFRPRVGVDCGTRVLAGRALAPGVFFVTARAVRMGFLDVLFLAAGFFAAAGFLMAGLFLAALWRFADGFALDVFPALGLATDLLVRALLPVFLVGLRLDLPTMFPLFHSKADY